ncbi:MAG: response regulator receiver protein [Alphaproteobacteria bacterium]|jgi:two-component system chemotaxis response regulator CheY|nr:response regulator receiver protein [Alphaproteobacteria bacterium]
MSATPSSLAVLVIDDHMIIRQVVEQNLKNMGFADIDTAGTAAEALERMAVRNYDIIFIDWIMPGKSGYTLMQECRQERKFDDVAFVMVTSESDERHMIEALKAGATSYIIKPVLANIFSEKVKKVLDWLAKRERKSDAQSA